MDIAKFFNVKSSKKRVLSSEQSRNECLRSLEQLVEETFDLVKKSSESQIKGELALQEVNKAISFITGEKFDAYNKKEGKMKKKN